MILVLGGGFGLYGHLVALLGAGHEVATLARYRQSVMARVELAPLAERVMWIDNECDALSRADTLILARRPEDHQAIVAAWRGERLVIEKPIAPDPASADRLVRPGLAVPYLYLYCDWYDRLARAGAGVIDWRLAPSRAGAEWKRDPAAGGGALAFYFIHCCAIAAAMFPSGDHRFEISDTLILLTSGEGKLRQSLAITTTESRFIVGDGDTAWFDGDSAFGPTPIAGSPDPRIAPLQCFYQDAIFGNAPQTPAFHHAVHRLWRQAANHAEIRSKCDNDVQTGAEG